MASGQLKDASTMKKITDSGILQDADGFNQAYGVEIYDCGDCYAIGSGAYPKSDITVDGNTYRHCGGWEVSF